MWIRPSEYREYEPKLLHQTLLVLNSAFVASLPSMNLEHYLICLDYRFNIINMVILMTTSYYLSFGSFTMRIYSYITFVLGNNTMFE